MKSFFTLAAAALLSINVSAYKTPGNGTTWSFATLAKESGSGVSIVDVDGKSCFLLTQNDTIAEGDQFVMDKQATVLFGNSITFVVMGHADFTADNALFAPYTEAGGQSEPYGIVVSNEVSQTVFTNCHFSVVGLRSMSSKGMSLSDCSFTDHNGLSGQAALLLGTNGAPFSVVRCAFTHCRRCAIAGAANYYNPLTIENCVFTENGQANGNTPQLNLTVASKVTVKDCIIKGDPTKNNVGGIVVANLMGSPEVMKTYIEDCHITDNRFGIATYLSQRAYIRNNIIVDNNHETNPNNGGSGINVYDPYNTQITYIEGNYIEGNLWGVTLVGGMTANLGRIDVQEDHISYNPGRNVFKNNGNNGVLYDLYNNSKNTVYAQGNTWNCAAQTAEEIEKVIFHKADDDALGEVIFMPQDDGVTILSADKTVNQSARAYNLQGILQASPSGRGISIVNGKKILR